jgi:hypothetical protein
MRITAKMLIDKSACAYMVTVFDRLWPDGVETSEKTCRQAANAGLDLDWFASHFLTATALAAYQQAEAPAWAAYQQAMAPALAAYRQAMAPALAAYQQAKAPALWSAIRQCN